MSDQDSGAIPPFEPLLPELVQNAIERWKRCQDRPFSAQREADLILGYLQRPIAHKAAYYARRYGGALLDPDDFAQTARVALLECLRRYEKARGGFYLYALATMDKAMHAEAIDGGVWRNEPNVEDLGASVPQLVTDFTEDADRRLSIEAALARLPAEWGYVIEQRYLREQTQDEVAAQLGCTRQNVSRIEHAALKRLQDILGPD